MKRLVVIILGLLCALAIPSMASASTSVGGREKGLVIKSWVAQDLLIVSHRQEQKCFRVQSFEGWAAATVGDHSPFPLCNIKADFGDGPTVWQPDVAIFHRITNNWRFVWEFDETNAREAGRHGIPPRVFRALVNRQLFGQ